MINSPLIRLSWLNQHGIFIHTYEIAPLLLVERYYGKVPPSRQRLITSKISPESPDVVPIEWHHFYPVLFVLIGGIVIGSLVLLVEIRTFKNRSKRRRNRRRQLREKERVGHIQFNVGSCPPCVIRSLLPKPGPRPNVRTGSVHS